MCDRLPFGTFIHFDRIVLLQPRFEDCIAVKRLHVIAISKNDHYTSGSSSSSKYVSGATRVSSSSSSSSSSRGVSTGGRSSGAVSRSANSAGVSGTTTTSAPRSGSDSSRVYAHPYTRVDGWVSLTGRTIEDSAPMVELCDE
jgi:hypothetical protein